MTTTLLVAVFAGLGGMFGWGLADFFAKKTIDQIGDVVTLVWGHIFGTGLLVILSVVLLVANLHTLEIPQSGGVWLGLAFFGALQALVYLLVYRGFGKGQLALLNPIFASYSGVVALFSILVFGEVITGNILVGIVTTFVGILILNLDGEALKKGSINFLVVPGFIEVASAAVLAAIWTLGWDRFVNGTDWLSYATYMYLFMSAALLLYVAVRRIKLVMQPHLWKYVFLIGLFEMGAYVAISWGFGSTSHTSVVALLSSAFSLPTIFLARVFLREKTTRLQAIGSLVIIAGIVLLFVA
jgi:drug/metabolite transporter (DMT)-like permease